MKNFTSFRLVPQELRSIYDKVAAAERINEDEAARLYRSTDINALGARSPILSGSGKTGIGPLIS